MLGIIISNEVLNHLNTNGWIKYKINDKSPKYDYLFHCAPYLLLMIIPNKDKNLWLNSIDALSFKFTPNHLPVFIPLSRMHITLFRIAKCLNGGLLNHPLLFFAMILKTLPVLGQHDPSSDKRRTIFHQPLNVCCISRVGWSCKEIYE